MAPADLRFELWFKGQKYGRGFDSLKVEWDPVGAAAKPMDLSNSTWGTDTSPPVETEWTKPSALRDSQIGIGKERRVGDGIQPQDLQESISAGDIQETQSLLESNFDAVARDDFAWLRELKDLNYLEHDIAELLINSEKDSPWIYFEPRAKNDLSIILGYHQPACVHHDRRRSQKAGAFPTAEHSAKPTNPTRLSRSTDEDSLICIIDELCRLAGVCPTTRDLNKWTGQVLFSSDNPEMTASVTYRRKSVSFEDMQISEDSQGRLNWTLANILIVLERFCSAVAQSQQSGLCCDSFTILRKSRDLQSDAIDLVRIDLKLATGLLFDLKHRLNPKLSAESICELFLGSPLAAGTASLT
jgi:hypothetical protein